MKTPLKRPRVGLEVELFILDSEGHPVDEVHKLIKNSRVRNLKFALTPEYSKQIAEVGAFPRRKVENAALGFLQNLESVMEAAEKLDLKLYPFGTYPGVYEPERHRNDWYKLKEQMLGSEFKHAASRVAGFHLHYCLPRGILNMKTQQVRTTINSDLKNAFLRKFNIAVAMEPALATIMQSSPFVDGRYLAKDSRMLLYRDIRYERNGEITRGIYYRKSLLGGLPPYMETSGDVNYWIQSQNKEWDRLARRAGISKKKASQGKNILDVYRGPIKVNKFATMELRGMDMCTPKYVFAAAILVKSAFKRIEDEELRVKRADRGVTTPFKVEDDVVYVPPFSVVKNELEFNSAIEGLENAQVANYTKRFVDFALKNSPWKGAPALRTLRKVIKKRRTTSDKIIQRVKNKGYRLDEVIPNAVCAEIALSLSDKFVKDIEQTKADINYLTDE